LEKKVLIVEDEALVAMDLEATLQSAGYDVTGIATTVAQAMEHLQSKDMSCVILDANLCGESSKCVAQWLMQNKTPFVFVSGYSPEQLGHDMQGVPHLPKPINYSHLLTTLKKLVA
jgi:DNA-binding response OmpR family regulator